MQIIFEFSSRGHEIMWLKLTLDTLLLRLLTGTLLSVSTLFELQKFYSISKLTTKIRNTQLDSNFQ